MAEKPDDATILSLAALMTGLFVAAALLSHWVVAGLGLVALAAVMRLQGALRFPRLVRWTRDLASGLARLARLRRPSPPALRVMAFVAGFLVLVLLIDRLALAAPGRGRGLTWSFDGLRLGFGGFTSGAWLGTLTAWTLVLAILGYAWLQLWAPVRRAGTPPARLLFFACLAGFVLLPLIFLLAVGPWAPDDPEANVEHTKSWLQGTMVALSILVGAAAAAPQLTSRARAKPAKGAPVGR